MYTHDNLWSTFEPLFNELGLDLFELEAPKGRTGTLKIYIQTLSGEPVSHSHCASASKVVLDFFEAQEKENPALAEYDWQLEVSSPGVNRKLRSPKHFQGALGERLRVVFREGTREQRTDRKVALGVLKEVNGAAIVLEEEKDRKMTVIPFNSIQKAQVDFLFK